MVFLGCTNPKSRRDGGHPSGVLYCDYFGFNPNARVHIYRGARVTNVITNTEVG